MTLYHKMAKRLAVTTIMLIKPRCQQALMFLVQEGYIKRLKIRWSQNKITTPLGEKK